MQNVPIRTPLGREIRGCFDAGPGSVLISADYSQIELRVLAQVADEPVLKEIFRSGEDVHTATASQVFDVEPDEIDPGMRSKAKMINYGIVYGLTDFGLADRLNIPREEAAAFIDAYFERFPRVRGVHRRDDRARQASRATSRRCWGRRRQIPELQARNCQLRTLGERLAVNTVIQGTAADIIKLAMVRCHARARGAKLQHAPDPADPRRAAVRGAARRGRGRARADRARDVRRLGARPAARRRRRRRRELARGEVAAHARAPHRATPRNAQPSAVRKPSRQLACRGVQPSSPLARSLRGALGARHRHHAVLAGERAREPRGDAQRRLRAERAGERRDPLRTGAGSSSTTL